MCLVVGWMSARGMEVHGHPSSKPSRPVQACLHSGDHRGAKGSKRGNLLMQEHHSSVSLCHAWYTLIGQRQSVVKPRFTGGTHRLHLLMGVAPSLSTKVYGLWDAKISAISAIDHNSSPGLLMTVVTQCVDLGSGVIKYRLCDLGQVP